MVHGKDKVAALEVAGMEAAEAEVAQEAGVGQGVRPAPMLLLLPPPPMPATPRGACACTCTFGPTSRAAELPPPSTHSARRRMRKRVEPLVSPEDWELGVG